MKKAVCLIALLGIGCLFNGCHRFAPDQTGISINENNVVRQVIKEDFSETGYSQEELASQIEYEVNVYNDAAGFKSVKSSGLKVNDGKAELTLIYATPNDFASFNNEDFFVGDMVDAIQNNYTLQGSFYEVKDGSIGKEEIWGSKLMSDGFNYKTIVFSEPTLLQIAGNIRYVSTNLKVTGPSTVVSETDELAYVLYE